MVRTCVDGSHFTFRWPVLSDMSIGKSAHLIGFSSEAELGGALKGI